MTALEQLLSWLQGTMPFPTMFGLFHLISLIVVILVTVIVAIQFRHGGEKTLRIILLTMAVTTLTFELYKQLVFTFHYDAVNEVSYWSYQWYAFPFHFCSIPMYLAPVAAFLKPGKVRQAIFNFLGTFGLFGGLAVMIYAEPVLISMIGISIQTMIHHGSQVVIGVFLLVSGRVQFNYKAMLGASIIFVIPVLLSILMNVVFYQINGTSLGVFNMFWISPYFATDLPILSLIKPAVPYPIFVIIYIVGFILIATIMLSLAMGIDRLIKQVKKPHTLIPLTH
jgi:hypothetical protein